MIFSICAIAALLFCSALTSGTETAMTGASRANLKHLAGEGDRRAALTVRMLEDQERLIGALLVGNNIFNILAAAMATEFLLTLAGEAGVVYATFVMTMLVVIFSEVLPKTYAIRNADRMARTMAPLARALMFVTAPAVAIVHWIVDKIMRLFGMRRADASLISAIDQLRGVIMMGAEEGSVRKHERDMLKGILDLEEVPVEDIMTHRKDVVSLDADAPKAAILEAVRANPYTRYPVWRGDPDQVIGVLRAKDLFATALAEDGEFDMAPLISAPWFVPNTTSLQRQLAQFRARRSHLAFVVDEYGGLMGIVTLEDVIEEIVGEIVDESDIEVQGLTRLGDGRIQSEGRVTLRDLNRELDWNLPDDDAATVAGLVIHEARRIPEAGERFELFGFAFTVKERDRRQLTLLEIEPLPDQGVDEPAAPDE